MPAPPPPPPMAPAAPPPPLMKMSKSSADDRGALLKSIRQGKKLKKAVTNDRSAPLVTGTPSSRPTPKTVNNNQMSRTTVSPMRELTLQEELKKQLANDNRNRGPPPPTPNRNLPGSNYQKQLFSPRENVASYQKQSFSQRENVANGLNFSQLALNVNNLQINPSTLHRKAKSNVNLNTMEMSDNNSKTNGFQPSKPVINHGKPNLAPKPPVLNGKPLLNPKSANRPSLNRAQSMKSAPRTPSPQSPVEATNAAIKFGTVRHMSSIIGQSLAANSGSQLLVNSAQHSRSRPALNGRPSAPPPSIPLPQSPFLPPSPSQPPPPPSKTNLVKHPNHAPPPPPPLASLPQAPPHAPPPPPHKTQISRQPPAIPSPVGSNSPINPPPPPPRNSSMREGGGPSNVCVDLEEKFKHLFQSPDRFPLPPPYRNVIKVYNSKPNMQKPGVV